MLEKVKNQQYEFDKCTLANLNKLEFNELMAELKKIMDKLIVFDEKVGKSAKDAEFPNLYFPCLVKSARSAPYCAGAKLKVEEEKYEELLKLLAIEMMNPFKKKFYMTGLSGGIIDYLKFEKHKNENITIVNL